MTKIISRVAESRGVEPHPAETEPLMYQIMTFPERFTLPLSPRNNYNINGKKQKHPSKKWVF
ncbi:MAG: hypothetical protein V1688_01160 [bacterium]